MTDWSDLYTWFDEKEYSAEIDTETEFTVNGLNIMQSGETVNVTAAPVGATVTVYRNGSVVSGLAAKTDGNGSFSLKFPSAGTYTIEVSGRCDYTCTAYGGGTGASYKDATVVPSRCTVVVSAGGGSSTTEDKDEKAAEAVDKLIDAIGAVTKDSKAKIDAARAAYDKLTDAQKKLVKNYDKLVKAESDYAKLVLGVPFVDVEKHWALDAIKYAYEKGLMNGVEDDKFAPDATLTRGMLVTVLYRMAGAPEVTGEGKFADVAASDWYAAAVKWAADNGIVDGVSDSAFAPKANITREQLAAMLYRFAQYMKYASGDTAALDKFEDAASVSDWAEAAMQWAVGAGLVSGRTDTTIVPGGTATRAESATLLMRFMENVAK